MTQRHAYILFVDKAHQGLGVAAIADLLYGDNKSARQRFMCLNRYLPNAYNLQMGQVLAVPTTQWQDDELNAQVIQQVNDELLKQHYAVRHSLANYHNLFASVLASLPDVLLEMRKSHFKVVNSHLEQSIQKIIQKTRFYHEVQSKFVKSQIAQDIDKEYHHLRFNIHRYFRAGLNMTEQEVDKYWQRTGAEFKPLIHDFKRIDTELANWEGLRHYIAQLTKLAFLMKTLGYISYGFLVAEGVGEDVAHCVESGFNQSCQQQFSTSVAGIAGAVVGSKLGGRLVDAAVESHRFAEVFISCNAALDFETFGIGGILCTVAVDGVVTYSSSFAMSELVSNQVSASWRYRNNKIH